MEPESGGYFVDAVDGKRVSLLLGPFATHAEALVMVDPARTLACELDPWAHFYRFGTCRVVTSKTGILNHKLVGETENLQKVAENAITDL